MPKDQEWVKVALGDLARGPVFEADLGDLEGRAARRLRSRRVGAAVVGVSVAAVGLTLAVLLLRPLGAAQNARPANKSGTTVSSPPEGEFLLQRGTDTELLSAGSNNAVSLGTDLSAYDISPDGSLVLATIGHQQDDGSFRQTEIVTTTAGGDRSSQVTAAPTEYLGGPTTWSPDGTRFVYFSSLIPAPPGTPDQRLCIHTVATGESTCFPDAGAIYTADWSPDGTQLVVDSGGNQPLRVLNAGTGSVSSLVPAGGSAEVKQALQVAGFSNVATLQFHDPKWSPSGTYIATSALTDSQVGTVGSLPLIFNTNGTLAAVGLSNEDPQLMSWSPASDLVAYTTGQAVQLATSTRPRAVYTLDPVTSASILVLTTEGQSDATIFGLVWAPSGRWLAVDDGNLIRIVEIATAQVDQLPIDSADTPGPLRDWGA